MALTPEQENQLEEMFKEKLHQQYTRGLQTGVLTVSRIILDKLNDASKPYSKRINDIKRFCRTPWNKQKEIGVNKPNENTDNPPKADSILDSAEVN